MVFALIKFGKRGAGFIADYHFISSFCPEAMKDSDESF